MEAAQFRILVIDDEAADLLLLLRQEGYDLCQAETDPARGAARFAAEDFDLVLLDDDAPGLELLAAIAEKSRREQIPLLLLCSRDDRDTRLQRLAAGARDFIGKPVDPVELGVRLGNLLEIRGLTLEVRRIRQRLEESVRERTRDQEQEQLRIAAVAFEAREGMMITDAQGVILSVNSAFSETTGYRADEVVGGTPRVLKSGRHDSDFYRKMWQTLNQTGRWQGEIWDRRKNGEVYPKHLNISAVKNEEGAITHYVGTQFDISEQKKAEERINELAYYDQLTGLANRTLMLDRLKHAMTSNFRSSSHGALMFINMDNFRTLNDTLGHDAGDLLLKQVAQRLTATVRENDTVARLGGDEFVVMLESLSTSAGEAATQTKTIGEKILARLNKTYLIGSHEHHCTSSIGITLFLGHHENVELLKRANLAMYEAKAAGRNTLRFFDPEMQDIVTKRVALEADLREGVLKGQFLLYFQAQVMGQGQLTGAEALVRWQHPQRGLVSPIDFIPLAEETGLILPLGRWVLETACAQLALWATEPEMAHLTLAVNVSARQFHQPDFVAQVLEIIERSGANPQRLKLELTESLLVKNVQEIIEKMNALKINAKGICFSLDDFGTGYSSLNYLKRLPLDQLKIDQSFVRDVLSDPNDAAIAKTVVALALSLGLGVIAEGVETEAQRAFLAVSSCHDCQGYFFSEPLPVAEFEQFAKQLQRPAAA